jgi:hypothetical protein
LLPKQGGAAAKSRRAARNETDGQAGGERGLSEPNRATVGRNNNDRDRVTVGSDNDRGRLTIRDSERRHVSEKRRSGRAVERDRMNGRVETSKRDGVYEAAANARHLDKAWLAPIGCFKLLHAPPRGLHRRTSGPRLSDVDLTWRWGGRFHVGSLHPRPAPRLCDRAGLAWL